jgi:Enoyl-(Acyl carrier protein) reductase
VRGLLASEELICLRSKGVFFCTPAVARLMIRHGRGKMVNIGPGLIETPMTRDLIADIGQAKYWQESIPWGHIGKPEDLVGAAIFLAADE